MGDPQIPPSTIAERIQALNRSPFRELVSVLLDNAPSQGAIVALAEKNHDRWGQLLAIVARLGGFNEKLEVEGTLTHSISSLSDAELADKIAALNHSFD